MIDPLTRGDDAVLVVSDLDDTDGNPTVFIEGDILQFTVRKIVGGADTVLTKSSVDGGISYAAGDSGALINIVVADWDGTTIDQVYPAAPWDIQLTRDGAVRTLDRGTVVLLPDVTR